MQRRKDIFGPDAEDFRPERWEEGLRAGYVSPPPLLTYSTSRLVCSSLCHTIALPTDHTYITQKQKSNIKLTFKLIRWEYVPFHGGPRICLGQQFALTQMSYTVFKFFQVFKSIESRDDGPLLVKTNITACFANGCLIAAVPVGGR